MPGLLGRFKAANQRFNGLLGGLIPPNNLGGLLSPEEAEAARRQSQLAMAANLLQASGPSLTPTSFAQNLGGGIMAGQQAQSGAIDSALSRKLLEAQLRQMQAPQEARIPNLIAELQSLGLPVSIEGVQQLTAAKGSQGTTINVGDNKMGEPIPITQLLNVRLPDGSTPPIGTTFEEARAMGATVKSSAEQQKDAQSESALGILDELETLALGPEGVFTGIEPGIKSRLGGAVEHVGNLVTQSNPNAARYDDLSQSTLAPFIKSLGESGALAEGDVQRALGLLPRTLPVPDTETVARQKFAALRVILQRGIRNQEAGILVGEDIPPLPDGFTLDPEEG